MLGAATERAETSPDAGDWSRVTAWVVGAVTVLALSVLTVLRYTVDYIQADGVQQSVMSIQDVDLFFWGQNRFFAVVSLLASPIADPGANLFACLLINAVAFHLLLLVIARMGVAVLTEGRQRWATLVVFLVFAATAHVVLDPPKLHIMALESQPYSASWALTLGAFLLWKRRERWALALALVMVGVAMGLNQSTVLVAAFLAVIEMLRRRQWVRWPAFGAVWVVWLVVWSVLSDRFGGTAGPLDNTAAEYFAFHTTQFVADAPRSTAAILGAFRPLRLVFVAAVAALCVLPLHPRRRVALLPRLALAFVFSLGYWVVFTGNPWVAANGYPFRYFYPVVLFVVLVVAVPLAAMVLAWCRPAVILVDRVRGRRMGDSSGARAALAGLAAAACVVALAGPLTAPTNATVLTQTRATADFARDNDVTFVSGYYWDMWPILHRTLEDGRQSVHITGLKSGGDPAAYLAAFERDLEGEGTPRAICVNDATSACVTYLEYWTRPGWVATDETCPVPGDSPLLGSPPQRSCVVIEYSGA